jgi:hypothetical protein
MAAACWLNRSVGALLHILHHHRILAEGLVGKRGGHELVEVAVEDAAGVRRTSPDL